MGFPTELAVVVALISCLIVPGSGQVTCMLIPTSFPIVLSRPQAGISNFQSSLAPRPLARPGENEKFFSGRDGHLQGCAAPCCIFRRDAGILTVTTFFLSCFPQNLTAGRRRCHHPLLLSRARLFFRVVPQVCSEHLSVAPLHACPLLLLVPLLFCSPAFVSLWKSLADHPCFLHRLQGRLLRWRQDGMRIELNSLRGHRPLHLCGQDRGN
jgi:hypothetical protein